MKCESSKESQLEWIILDCGRAFPLHGEVMQNSPYVLGKLDVTLYIQFGGGESGMCAADSYFGQLTSAPTHSLHPLFWGGPLVAKRGDEIKTKCMKYD